MRFQQYLNRGKNLKIVFAVIWIIPFLFVSGSNINSQFIDRASNRVYAQEMEVPLQEVTCSDGTAPDVTIGLCADGSQPQGQVPENAGGAAGGVAEQQLVCSDGTAPDVTTGLCADGSQPQGQAPPQLVCSDGTAPDVTTGLCADGSQPQGQVPENASGAAGGVAPEQQLVCSDGTAPDVTTGLCADGSQPQGQAPPQLVCSDGTAPDVTTGLCADGSQPQGQVPENASGAAGGVAAEQQLVCSDGAAPDVTTGLCADGSQPQASAVSQTDVPANVTGFSSSPTTQDTQEVERRIVPQEEPIQPVRGGETCDPARSDDKETLFRTTSYKTAKFACRKRI